MSGEDCRLLQIADALAEALNNPEPSGLFSLDFQAAVRVRPAYSLQEAEDLLVQIVPRSQEALLLDRSSDQVDYRVDVAVLKRLDPARGDEAQLREFLAFMEELSDALNRIDLPDLEETWIATMNDPIYVPEHLDTLRQFTSVLTLTFRGRRP